MRLVALLPPPVAAALAARPDLDAVIEVVMDLGRRPLARLPGPVGDVPLSSLPVTREDLDAACASVGDFGDDNRAGIDRTLHRVSALRNRDGRVVGLTCRVGRAVRGSADAAADLVAGGTSVSGSSSGPSSRGRPLSVLLLGRPGVGKTTAIREIARLLADDVGRRVVVVDTSNEIAGDGDVPHAALGSARRLMVAATAEQHRVMVEAVENHMPECVVIDEVGTEAEAMACRTIAQRGVQLVATAHGGSLASLIKNPALSDLIGGIECVTLGDDEARRRSGQASGGRKTALERASPPTFDAAVEMLEPGVWRVHADLAASVDAALSGASQALQPVPTTRLRVRTADGGVLSLPSDAPLEDALALRGMTTRAAAAAMELVMRNSAPSSAAGAVAPSAGGESPPVAHHDRSRGGGGVVIIKEPDAAVAAAVAAALLASSEAAAPAAAAEVDDGEEDEDASRATASYFASSSSALSLFSNAPDTLPGPGLAGPRRGVQQRRRELCPERERGRRPGVEPDVAEDLRVRPSRRRRVGRGARRRPRRRGRQQQLEQQRKRRERAKALPGAEARRRRRRSGSARARKGVSSPARRRARGRRPRLRRQDGHGRGAAAGPEGAVGARPVGGRDGVRAEEEPARGRGRGRAFGERSFRCFRCPLFFLLVVRRRGGGRGRRRGELRRRGRDLPLGRGRRRRRRRERQDGRVRRRGPRRRRVGRAPFGPAVRAAARARGRQSRAGGAGGELRAAGRGRRRGEQGWGGGRLGLFFFFESEDLFGSRGGGEIGKTFSFWLLNYSLSLQFPECGSPCRSL